MGADGLGVGRTRAETEAVFAHRTRLALEHFRKVAESPRPMLCPICGYEGPFAAHRHKPSVWCPGCDSRPRHRLLKLWLDRAAPIGREARVLHFAAEPWMRAALAHVREYATADLHNPAYDVTLDLEAMALPEGRFDVIVANHVLEHVDDRAALAEIRRVLSPGGFAVLTVPLVEGWAETLEQGPDWGPEERRLYCTDPDHRRFYGRDFRDRLRAAGLAPDEFTAVEPDVARHGLTRGETVFVARKPR
ncbi:MAG: class I SAM-dependent methyltransferase [Paracoccaceae bacterium]